MATVWRGEDPLLARSVAVKTLDPTLAEDEALRTRFRREAVAAAAVAHPNIVATYDTGEDDGVAYIVMELVEGATLRQAIDSTDPCRPRARPTSPRRSPTRSRPRTAAVWSIAT